jgi:hypothetical protein
MRINTSNVKQPEPVAAGTYEATFTGHNTREKNAKGNPDVKLEFTITEDCDFKGRKVSRYYSLLEQSLWSIKGALKTLGADEDTVDDPEGFDLDEVLPELYGTEVIIETTLRDSSDADRGPMAQVDRIRDAAFA